MARRRTTKRRRRRGRFGFLYKLLSILLIVAAILAACVVFFKIEDVEVLGTARYTPEEVVAAAALERGDNLFFLHRAAIVRGILVQLPYVDEINIKRALPDTLVITITDCVPAACMESEGNWWLIDTKGKLLEQGGASLAEQHAKVTGLTPILPSVGSKLAVGDADRNKLQTLLYLLAALKEREMGAPVTAIDLSQTSAVTLHYDGRFTVDLPMTADADVLSGKILDLKRTLEVLERNESGNIDLTGERGYFRPD
ncbi:MAG: FtsQ-type POTRA domain-containing protein [Clostridiales bacterium]|nr:FtsQ-type POTRA domain-containing protein [Clostridiales bacterium]